MLLHASISIGPLQKIVNVVQTRNQDFEMAQMVYSMRFTGKIIELLNDLCLMADVIYKMNPYNI